MASKNICIEITFAWWFLYLYLPLLMITFKCLRRVNPDIQIDQVKFNKWLKRATRIKVKR